MQNIHTNKYYSDWTKKEWTLIILYTLISFQFYFYAGFSNTMIKLPLFLTVPIMFAICWKTLFSKNANKLFHIMRGVIIVTILSIFSAYIFRNQSIVLGYRAIAAGLTLIFYFYLYKRRPSIQSLETYIFIFGILYCILWLYAMSKFPEPVFGFNEDGEVKEDLSRGMIRINFLGRISLIFAYFLSLNRAYVQKKKIYFVIAAVFFIFIIMQVTRQLIAWSALVTIIYVFQKNRKLLIFGGIILVFLFFFGKTIKFSQDSVIGTMIAMTEEQMDNSQHGDEDIRITEYKYFFTEWSHSIITDIIGNGMPHGNSAYGKYYAKLQEQQKLYLSDVGYGQMFVITGWIGLFLYIVLFIKCCLIRMPEELMYAKMFILFLLLANIAASWYAKADCQIAMCISIYLMTVYALPQLKDKKITLL